MSLSRSMLGVLAALVIFGGIGFGALLSRLTNHATTQVTQQRAMAPEVVSVRSHAPAATPTTAPTSTPPDSPHASGTWRFDEANVAVGTIVWIGNAAIQHDEMIFDLHKQSVAGRPAVPCERETELRIVLRRDHAPDTVPYHEVNCDGQAQDGQVRISALPSNGSFSGSFWNGATKLGDFAATSQ